MGSRDRLPLPFGRGLDRATGPAAVDADSMGDLRNVALMRARTELRPGLERALLSAWGTEIVGIFPIRAQGLSAMAVYDSVSGDVRLYIMDASGASAALVGTLWTLDPSAPAPPRVIGADSYDKLVLAHDEPVFGFRQVTMVYSPTDGSLGPLLSDLARTGAIPAPAVKFRGVARYLNYLVGWGYGTSGDEDRGEILRISNPGLPTTFDPEHYFLVGAKGDPILGVGICAQGLALHKAAESLLLVGYDRQTFGVRPLDHNYGLIASRAHATLEGEDFFWTLQGPRVTTGGPSDDLALPLDLGGPLPDALAASSDADYAFAFYDPTAREVVFVFGQWAYVLHLRDGERRWSYRPYGVALTCAAQVYTGEGVSFDLAASPDIDLFFISAPSYAITPGDDYLLGPGVAPLLNITWVASGGAVSGTEQVEVWIKSHFSGGWAKRGIYPSSAGGAQIRVRHFGTAHDVALRYMIGGIPQSSHANVDPALWPAVSRGTIITSVEVASIEPERWERTGAAAQSLGIVYNGPGFGRGNSNEELTFEIEYSIDAKATWHALPGGMFPADVHQDPDSAQAIGFDNTFAAQTMYFRVRAIAADFTTAWHESATGRWMGPEAPKFTAVGPDTGGGTPGNDEHTAFWTDGEHANEGASVETKGYHAPGGAIGAVVTTGPGVGQADVQVPTPNGAGYTPHIMFRSKLTTSGVTDYSAWVDDVGAAE